jgi:serine/threonine-protein kinase RsbW
MATPEEMPPMQSPNEVVLETSCQGNYLAEIRAFVANQARQTGFDEEEIAKIEVAVGEACSNIAKHAYAPDPTRPVRIRDPRIRLVVRGGPDRLVIELHDHGRRFDFANYRPTDIDRSLRDMDAGGYGIAIIRRFIDEVQYSSNDPAGNTLRMVKYLKKT